MFFLFSFFLQFYQVVNSNLAFLPPPPFPFTTYFSYGSKDILLSAKAELYSRILVWYSLLNYSSTIIFQSFLIREIRNFQFFLIFSQIVRMAFEVKGQLHDLWPSDPRFSEFYSQQHSTGSCTQCGLLNLLFRYLFFFQKFSLIILFNCSWSVIAYSLLKSVNSDIPQCFLFPILLFIKISSWYPLLCRWLLVFF